MGSDFQVLVQINKSIEKLNKTIEQQNILLRSMFKIMLENDKPCDCHRKDDELHG